MSKLPFAKHNTEDRGRDGQSVTRHRLVSSYMAWLQVKFSSVTLWSFWRVLQCKTVLSFSYYLKLLDPKNIFILPSSNLAPFFSLTLSPISHSFLHFENLFLFLSLLFIYFCHLSSPAHISSSCPRVCYILRVLVLARAVCRCVGPGCAMRLPTPGLAWLSEPETGPKNGSVRALPPTWRTLSGPKHNKYSTVQLLPDDCSLLQLFYENNLMVFFKAFLPGRQTLSDGNMSFWIHQFSELVKPSLLWPSLR